MHDSSKHAEEVSITFQRAKPWGCPWECPWKRALKRQLQLLSSDIDWTQLLYKIIMEPRAIGRELIESIPVWKQGWQVSEPDTHKIAKMLGTWWEMLATKLRFDKSEVDNIKTQYINDLEMQKYQLMLRWNYRNESKATYRVILNQLCDLEQINCLDEVCKLLHAQSEPSLPPPTALARYSDDLKCAYSNHEYQTVVDWPPLHYGNFTRPAMISEQGVRKGKMDLQFIGQITEGNVKNILKSKIEIQLCEIFDKTKGNVVLLEGAPGSGKTTLCWYVCQEWGRGQLFQQFTHVLMVELHDEHTQSAECLADILPYCEGEEAEKIAEELKEKNGENVLVILEGWDQLHEKKRKKSIFKCLIEKGTHCPLHKAVILISSRSSVSACLAKTRVEILGFTPEQILQYVQASFGEVEKAEGLLTKIRQNPKLQETCYFPLNLMLIVHLYSIDQQLPESFCSVIIQLVLTCLYRYRRNKLVLEDNFDSFDDLPDDIKPQFLELCKLAFEATMEERYSFSNLTTDNLELMQSVQSIAARGNKTTQYFLHSSLQELCAAIHISTQPIPEQKRILDTISIAPKDYVLRFYSALTHWEDPSLCKLLFEHSVTIINAPNIYSTKPKPFSQRLLPHLVQIIEMRALLDSLIKERPLDQDKLASMRVRSVLEPAFCETLAVTQHRKMKFSDASFNRDEHLKETCEQIKNVLVNYLPPAQGRDGTKMKKEHIKRTLEALVEVLIACYQECFPLIVQKNDIPEDVLFTQKVQMIQQTVMRLPIKENPWLQMEIPVSSQEQLGHNSRLLVHNTFKKLAKESKFAADLIMLLLQMNDNTFLHQPFKIYVQFFNKYFHNTTLNLQVAALLVDGIITQHRLILIHCIYEAGNPALAQILGPRLELAGELNASDLIALQSILEGSEESGCGCNLNTLFMIAALPPTEVDTVTKIIKRNSTIKELTLLIGCYDEALVQAVFSKPTIRSFRHSWTMEDEEDCIHSCKSFFSCLRGNQNLQALDLSYHCIHDHGAKELATVINTTRLVEINLTRCRIGEEGIKALSSALEYNAYLSILHLNEAFTSPAALKHLSQSLRHNNSLTVLGMFEDPAATDLTEANFEEFIMHLCFNSSLVCIMLNSARIPPLQEAVAFVNRSRRSKHLPQLSVEDEYSQNHNPETYNFINLQPYVESEAMQNVSISQLLQPNLQMVHINACVQTRKTPYLAVCRIIQFTSSNQDQEHQQNIAMHYSSLRQYRIDSLGLLLALIRGNTPDIDQVTYEHVHSLMQDLHQYIEVTIPSQLLNVVTVNGGSIITCPVSHNQSKIFSILLDILLYCISLMIA